MQNLPTRWNEREELRNKGQFWTPDWVARAMVSYVATNTELIFDPATGGGAFLEALLSLDIPNVDFFGTDIDEAVLDAPIYNHPISRVEKRDFILNPPSSNFKSIVANPPYIRHHRLSAETKMRAKALTYDVIGKPIDGRAGIHIYFLIQALSRLEPEGKLAFIMPADTCEGHFARTLWDWILAKFRVECAITFDEKATPFPGVDTNALIFMIENSPPIDELVWVKVLRPGDDLVKFVNAKFQSDSSSLEIHNRSILEAKVTGLSRKPRTENLPKYRLSDFASVMRGIATGANEFFLMNSTEVAQSGIPENHFKRVVGRTRDVTVDELTSNHLDDLDKKCRPTYLLSIEGNHGELHPNIRDYLDRGEQLGLPLRALIQQRKPWYKMEQRKAPAILFTYLGRRNSRFIKNSARILPLTGFLCVYPHLEEEDYVHRLWSALNHPDTIAQLASVGKSYGSGAIKVEPSKLKSLPIPDHIVEEFGLEVCMQRLCV